MIACVKPCVVDLVLLNLAIRSRQFFSQVEQRFLARIITEMHMKNKSISEKNLSDL